VIGVTKGLRNVVNLFKKFRIMLAGNKGWRMKGEVGKIGDRQKEN